MRNWFGRNWQPKAWSRHRWGGWGAHFLYDLGCWAVTEQKTHLSATSIITKGEDLVPLLPNRLYPHVDSASFNCPRGLYSDGETVIPYDVEAMVRDGKLYHKAYTWYFQMKDGKASSNRPLGYSGF